MATADEFRWQALFQHSRDAVFVLSRRRRLMFVNRAWEALTGQSAVAARGLTCTRRSSDRPLAALARTLSPPPDVMDGRSARVVRALPGADDGPPWWEIEFLPLADESGVIGIIGKITATGPAVDTTPSAIPEAWAAVRADAAEHFRLDAINADRQPTLANQVRLAAANRCPVYIAGEAGTGKRWLARAIHYASDRRELPFAGLDCAHLPSPTLRGVLDHTELIGTLYLHEPAALPREFQAELAGRLAGPGESGPRVIAGTAEADDPKRPVFLGRLLPELYDALAVLLISLPPLRARKDELPRFVDEMLKRAAPAIGKSITGLTNDAGESFRAYSWPGNLRELYATLLSAGRRAAKDQIDLGDLPLVLQQATAAETPPPPPAKLPSLDSVLEEAERRLIRLALRRAGGNQSKAAEMLAVWRPRLVRRIKVLGLDGDR